MAGGILKFKINFQAHDRNIIRIAHWIKQNLMLTVKFSIML